MQRVGAHLLEYARRGELGPTVCAEEDESRGGVALLEPSGRQGAEGALGRMGTAAQLARLLHDELDYLGGLRAARDVYAAPLRASIRAFEAAQAEAQAREEQQAHRAVERARRTRNPADAAVAAAAVASLSPQHAAAAAQLRVPRAPLSMMSFLAIFSGIEDLARLHETFASLLRDRIDKGEPTAWVGGLFVEALPQFRAYRSLVDNFEQAVEELERCATHSPVFRSHLLQAEQDPRTGGRDFLALLQRSLARPAEYCAALKALEGSLGAERAAGGEAHPDWDNVKAAAGALAKIAQYVEAAAAAATGRERSIELRQRIAGAPELMPPGVVLDRLLCQDEFIEMTRQGDGFAELQRVALYLFPSALLVCARQERYRAFGRVRGLLDVFGSVMPLHDLTVMMVDGPPAVLRLHAGDTELLLHSSTLNVLLQWASALGEAAAAARRDEDGRSADGGRRREVHREGDATGRAPFYPAPNRTHVPKRR